MNEINFDQASTASPKAPGVARAMFDYIDSGGFNAGRGAYAAAYRVEDMVLDTRERLCSLFGFKSPRNVVFTPGITYALNTLIQGFLRPRDHVICTSMEHNGVMRPLRALEKRGLRLDIARCGPDGRLDASEVEALICPETKAVVMTHASNVCGTVLPVGEIGEMCARRGIRLIVDSAQTAGVLPIDMEAMHIDALCFAGHKGLGGPQGIGGFLISKDMEKEVQPLICGGTGSASDSEQMPGFMPDKFEAGTLNLPGIAGLQAALIYLESNFGKAHAHEIELCQSFIAQASGLDGIRLLGLGGAEGRVAIVSADFPGRDNAAVSYALAKQGIMTRCGLHCAPRAHMTLGTFPVGTVRFSFGQWNTLEQVEECAAALREILKQ